MPQMCSYSSSIKSVNLQNNLNEYHFFLWMNKIMSFFMRNHQSRTIGSKPFLENEDEDMVVIVKWVLDTMVLMVVIPQIPINNIYTALHHQKWSNLTQNKKMGSVYRINLPKTMRVIAINVVWNGIGCLPVVHPNIWLTFTKH